MDRQKRLLVEGKTDYFFFQALFDEFLGAEWQDTCNFVIDKAENLISLPNNPQGNREKVEHAISVLLNTPLQSKLVGFVDREFREFTWTTDLVDQIGKHMVQGQLVWSRGHSVENYFLDAEILHKPFRDVSDEIFSKAYHIFRQNVENYMRTATTITLTALELHYLNKIVYSLDWNTIGLNGEVNLDVWETRLSELSYASDKINQIIACYKKWADFLRSANDEIIKWFCHGHIGFYIIWRAFARCTYESIDDHNDRERLARKVFKYTDEDRFKMCATSWASSAQQGTAQYPTEIFLLLELSQIT